MRRITHSITQLVGGRGTPVYSRVSRCSTWRMAVLGRPGKQQSIDVSTNTRRREKNLRRPNMYRGMIEHHVLLLPQTKQTRIYKTAKSGRRATFPIGPIAFFLQRQNKKKVLKSFENCDSNVQVGRESQTNRPMVTRKQYSSTN